MSALKSFLKKIPGIKQAGSFVKRVYLDSCAIRDFRVQRSTPHGNGPIRVGFLCEYIPAWSKVASVYSKMLGDNRFAPYIICVPSDINKAHLVPEENDTYRYFSQAGYACVNAVTKDGQWLSLKDMHLDYIFYLRPYNDLLPIPYRTQTVCRYSKICLLMYGIAFAEEDARVELNRDFMSRVYFYFEET